MCVCVCDKDNGAEEDYPRVVGGTLRLNLRSVKHRYTSFSVLMSGHYCCVTFEVSCPGRLRKNRGGRCGPSPARDCGCTNK